MVCTADSDKGVKSRTLGFLDLLVVLAGACASFPLLGAYPHFFVDPSDTDNSWIYALNAAHAGGFQFGKDVVFTYGPLGFLLFPLGIGSNVLLSSVFKGALHLFWWFSIWRLRCFFPNRIAYCCFVGVSACCGLPLGHYLRQFERASIFVLCAANWGALALHSKKDSSLYVLGAFSALCFLLKINIGIACLVLALAAALLNWQKGRGLLRACRVMLAAACALPLFFVLSGSSIGFLGRYLELSFAAAFGYSSHMSTAGCSLESAALGIAAAVAVIAACMLAWRKQPLAVGLWFVAVPLFLAFKAAVVRSSYLVNFVPNALLAAALLSLAMSFSDSGKRNRGATLLCGVLFTFGLGLNYSTLHAKSPLDRPLPAVPLAALYRGELAEVEITPAKPFCATGLAGGKVCLEADDTADVYPKLAALGAKYDFTYQPRGVFQSYAAYHPVLDAFSADRLASAKAPEYIIYGYDPVDDGYPFGDDPLTWRAIVNWYDVAGWNRRVLRYGSLLLKRRESERFKGKFEELSSLSVSLGDWVELPPADGSLIFAEISLSLSPLGRLKNAVAKIVRPEIELQYVNGGMRKYRIAWNNAESGILVSDLPISISEIRALFDGRPERPVQRFRITASSSFSPLFHLTMVKRNLLTAAGS